MKKILSGLLILGAVVFASLFIFAKLPTSTRPIIADIDKLNTPDMIAKGEYLAKLGDCSACHSQDGKVPFTGGAAIKSPIGNMYATNITPNKETGIGLYSLDEFGRALRNGIRKDGVTLYPAMPYPSFSNLTDDDVSALYAYFFYGLKAESANERKDEIAWPLSIRWPVAIWRKAFAPTPSPFDATRYADSTIARGAYIVTGLAHCGACHTPRSLTLAEKGLDETNPHFLSGETLIDGWVAINLRDDDDGLKNWTKEDIVLSLRNGENPKTSVIGSPMNDFVQKSGRFFSDDDLNAIASYLKTLPAKDKSKVKYQATTEAVDINSADAAYIYQDNCSSCHGTTGNGIDHLFPSLVANPTVLSDNPQSVVRVVLNGFNSPSFSANSMPLSMPALGKKLSDEDIAKTVNFIRTNWGNNAKLITKSDVTRVRNEFGPKQ